MSVVFESKEIRRVEVQERRWTHIAGVLYDTTRMLETMGRTYRGPGFSPEGLDDLRRLVSLVASHALNPLVEELNSERVKWFLQLQDLRAQENSNSVKY